MRAVLAWGWIFAAIVGSGLRASYVQPPIVPLVQTPVTLATLGSCTLNLIGYRGMISDANGTTFGSIQAGGGVGTPALPIYCDGVNWRNG